MPFSDRFEKEYTRDTYSEVSTRPDLTERLRDVPPQHRMAVAFDQEPFDPYWHPGKDAMDRWDQVEIENSVFAAHAQDAPPERQADYEALQVFNQAQQTSQGSYGPDQERIMASAQEAQEHSARHLYDVMQRDPAFRDQIPEHLQERITQVREAQHAHDLDMHERFPEEYARPDPLPVSQVRSDDLVVDDREPVPVQDAPEMPVERDADNFGREPVDQASDRDAQSIEAWSNDRVEEVQEYLGGRSSSDGQSREDLEMARVARDRQSFGRNGLYDLAEKGHGKEYVADKAWYHEMRAEREAMERPPQQAQRDHRDTDRDGRSIS